MKEGCSKNRKVELRVVWTEKDKLKFHYRKEVIML